MSSKHYQEILIIFEYDEILSDTEEKNKRQKLYKSVKDRNT